MAPGRVVLITGGVRSGKSAFAERLATEWTARPAAAGQPHSVVYVATSRVWDGEMAARVSRHRAQRPPAWQTIEAPLDIAAAVAAQPPILGDTHYQAGSERRPERSEGPAALTTDVRQDGPAAATLVESIDAWVSNRLLEANPVAGELLDRQAMEALEAALVTEAQALVRTHRACGTEAPLLLVTLEAGMGVVPPSPLGRAFRDLLGRVNATLAAAADQVYLLVAGLPVDVKRLSEELARTARTE